MAEAAVSFAVEKLGNLLIDKAVFLTKVKGDVEWVRDELKSMQCFLKDAVKKERERGRDSERIKKWISDIREVAHDAEDAIEIFVLKVESKSLKKRYVLLPNHLYRLYKVGRQIASIREKLKDIRDRRVTYDIQIEEASTMRSMTERKMKTEMRRRVDYWNPDDQQQQQVVGLEKDVNKILGKAVLEKSKGLSVAAISGMGGIGKSTLASKIYNHPEVASRFDFRSWVVVSSEFNPEDILTRILLNLGISDDELKRLGSTVDNKLDRQEELKKEVYKRLTGKRYFIVLDDVWEHHHWEYLTTAFPDGDKGSRLLLTSRNPIITENSGYVHRMEPLEATESWSLFTRRAFGGNTSIPEGLKEVGEEILKRCGGLPLAISVVGGLLARKTPSKSEWEKFSKEMKSHLDIYTSSRDLDIIESILELSYQNLTPELKACFLCFGFFKEDAVIKAKELVQIWVAQGLVAQEVEGDGLRMEEVARDYLNELIGRNMVQVKKMAYHGDKVKSCGMHDLLRDLSIRKAKEEIDFEVEREGQNSSHQSLAKPRHRAIYYSQTIVPSTNRNKHIRCLFIHDSMYCWTFPLSYWKSFELLKILHFESHKLPEEIGDLIGLRYLRVRVSSGSMLPRSWAKLKNLEVLHISAPYGGVLIIDEVILHLDSLRHLYGCVYSYKVGLGNMRKLQTLHRFKVMSSDDFWKIQGMTGVSELGIILSFDNVEEKSSLCRCLSSLENLSNLTLELPLMLPNLEGLRLNNLHRLTRLKLKADFRWALFKLPTDFPPNLSHLTLSKVELKEDPMPILEKLPNLIYLKLNKAQNAYYMWNVVIACGGFHSLEVLHFKNFHLVEMKMEESAMPQLNQLIIQRCQLRDFKDVPERIKSTIVRLL